MYVAPEPSGPGGGKAIVTVRRSGTLTGSVHVDFATSAGTAVPGLDYVDTAGQITFGPGIASGTFAVSVLANTSDEPNPTVNLALGVVDVPLGTPRTALLTLGNNDLAGTAQLAAAAFSGVASAESIRITVVRSGGTAGPASVEYATTDGTAVQTTDYSARAGTLTFAPGETSKAFAVPVSSTGPPNKYFTVTLGATTGRLALGPRTEAPVWIVE
jgi:chitinase